MAGHPKLAEGWIRIWHWELDCEYYLRLQDLCATFDVSQALPPYARGRRGAGQGHEASIDKEGYEELPVQPKTVLPVGERPKEAAPVTATRGQC